MEVSLTLMPAPDVLVAMVMYSAVKRPVQPSAAPTQSLPQENVVQYVPVVSEVFLLRVFKDVHLFTFIWMIGIAQLLGSSTQMQCILRSIYRGVTIYLSKLHVSLNLSMIFLDWWILQFITSDVVLLS